MTTFAIDPRSGEFDSKMRQRIAGYFANRKKTGDARLYVKATILLLSLFTILIIFSTTDLPGYLEILLCIILGFIIPGIGFNIMHDAVHRSFCANNKWNKILSYSLNLLGGYWPIWEQQHNVEHHMNTNIDGRDGDIDFGIIARLHPSQAWRKWHKYQHIYMPLIFYPLSYLGWIFVLDFIKAKKLNYKFHQYVSMVISKAIHLLIFIGLPILKHSLGEVILGYVIVTVITGIIISFIFQLAHVVEITEMLDEPEDGKVKRDVVHQLRTTANFATKNKILSWYIGGLNFQVEHHLYYSISHVHYPDVNKMVKMECKAQNLPYHEYPNLSSAVISHIKTLKGLGRDPKQIAT